MGCRNHNTIAGLVADEVIDSMEKESRKPKMTGTVRGEDGITARMIHNTTRTWVAYVVYAWLLDAGQMTSLLYASYGVCEYMNMVFYASVTVQIEFVEERKEKLEDVSEKSD